MQFRAVLLSSSASLRLCASAFKKVVTVMNENEISKVMAKSNLLEAIPCRFLVFLCVFVSLRLCA
jgi:hypothetical protein